MSTRNNALVGAIGVGVIVCGVATSAQADGYSAPRAYAPPSTWSGFYVGGNIGYSWADVDGVYSNFAPTQHFDADPRSGILGAHIGLQGQSGQFVLGVEAAYSSTRVFSNDWNRGTLGPSAACLAINPTPTTCEARVDKIFTIGPRLGYTPVSHMLLYATGGFATGSLDTRLLDRATVPVSVFDKTKGSPDGWFVGGGVEYAVTRNWILGVEYQHVELNSLKEASSADGGSPGGLNARTMSADLDIVRARVSYKFGDERRNEPLK